MKSWQVFSSASARNHLYEQVLGFFVNMMLYLMSGGIDVKTTVELDTPKEIFELCVSVRKLAENGEYEKCFNMICKIMGQYPHAAQPHNLLGIVLEHCGEHVMAMKHFRVACALDPTYKPALKNILTFGTSRAGGEYAYD